MRSEYSAVGLMALDNEESPIPLFCVFNWASEIARRIKYRHKNVERTSKELRGKREMAVNCKRMWASPAIRRQEKESNPFGRQPEKVSAGSEMQQRLGAEAASVGGRG